MRLALSLLVLLVFLVFRKRYFLLLLPFIEYPGFLFMTKEIAQSPYRFIIDYAELLLLLLFAFDCRFKLRGPTVLFLFLFPFLSVPSLFQASANLYISLYITILMSLAVFLYQYYLVNMGRFMEGSVTMLDMAILALVLLGLFTKIYEGYRWGPELAAYYHPLVYGILSRGGGIGASNHIGGILLFLLPLTQNPRVLIIAVIFLIISFSRGIYATLAILGMLQLATMIHISGRLRVRKAVLKGVVGVLVVVAVLFSNVNGEFRPDSAVASVSHEFIQRLAAFASVGENVRNEIHDQAYRIIGESYGAGVGLGGFFWGQELIGEKSEYSNAHNLYLTLLAEGGVFFFTAFIGLIAYIAYLAYRYDKRALVSISVFAFYGLFSGQIYEVSGRASAFDYYYILFLLAYLKYKQITARHKETPVTG